MKKILMYIPSLLLLLCCKEEQVKVEKEDEQVVVDFSIVNNNNGTLKTTDVSQDITAEKYYYIAVGNQFFYSTAKGTHTFDLDLTGSYRLVLTRIPSSLGGRKDTTIQVTMSPERELGYFKGEWFGKQTEVYESFDKQIITNFFGVGVPNLYLLKSEIPFTDTYMSVFNYTVKSDSLINNQMKYNQFKDKLKVGVQGDNQWSINLSDPSIGDKGNSLNKKIEILEVREVVQRKIIPEMMDKCFWVTMKIQADFGTAGKIDGILKTRYLIYENVVY